MRIFAAESKEYIVNRHLKAVRKMEKLTSKEEEVMELIGLLGQCAPKDCKVLQTHIMCPEVNCQEMPSES